MTAIATQPSSARMFDAALVRDVKAELERIIAHPLFKDTTRLKRFLRYVVEETLAGRAERLKGYSVGLEVFDRPESFDPQADTIVRVQAGQLRRRLDLYYAEIDGLANQDTHLRILLPKGRYVPVFEMHQREGRATGPALLEGPSDGSVADTDADAPDMGSAAQYSDDPNRPGIYVPTFSDLSPDHSQTYFAEGLTAEVINALVQFRYLRIIAGNGSVHKDQSDDIKTIAKTFNADFILVGTVRRSGDLVRVSTNLISTQTGDHVLSKIFDRECTPEKLFEIQENIASYTAANVGAPFGAINRYNRRILDRSHIDMGGYSTMLKYYTMRLDANSDDAEHLVEELRILTQDSPYFSSAWAALSLLHSFFVGLNVPSVQPERSLKAAQSEAHRAVGLDPDNALAFHAQFAAAYHAGDFETYEYAAERALALNPNDYNLLAYYALTKAMRGDCAAARHYHQAAVKLISVPPTWFSAADVCCDLIDDNFDSVIKKTDGLTIGSPAGVILFRLAACGLSDQVHLAAELRDDMLSADPNIYTDALESFRIWHAVPALYERVEAGLKAAFVSA